MDWLRFRKIYFSISLIAIGLGLFGLINWGLKLGVDFKGGSILEYKFEREISTEEATKKLTEEGFEVASVQMIGNNSYLFRFPLIEIEQKEKIESVLSEMGASGPVSDSESLETRGEGLRPGGKIEELRFESVGPSIGPELVKKTIYAIFFAATTILLWVAYQFKSFKFGTSAILAMFHDSFILIGFFALLGHFFGAEIDFLFVTALLTTLSFSVHDTIVVYDRIRESQKKYGGDLVDLANRALTETMVRSLNNSFTIAFMLVSLLLLGGTTVKWFAVALLIGTVLGTYSSPFVAVPLLVIWDDLAIKIKNLKFRRKKN